MNAGLESICAISHQKRLGVTQSGGVFWCSLSPALSGLFVSSPSVPWERFHINKIIYLLTSGSGNPMPTSQEYRQQADTCLELVDQAQQWYVRMALLELAAEFKKRADDLEQHLAA